MKTVCKKLLSLMLVAMLLVSAVPFQVFAGEVENSDQIITEDIDTLSEEDDTTTEDDDSTDVNPGIAPASAEDLASTPAVAMEIVPIAQTKRIILSAPYGTGYDSGVWHTLTVGQPFNFPNVTIPHQTLTYWYYSDGTNEYRYQSTDIVDEQDIAKITTLRANFVVNQYNVVYQKYNTAEEAFEDTAYGATVEACARVSAAAGTFPSDAQIATDFAIPGYTIVGWEIANDAQTSFVPGSTQITGNIRVRPRYQRTVTLMVQNPTDETSSIYKTMTVELGERVGALDNPGIRNGSTFVAWWASNSTLLSNIANLSNTSAHPVYTHAMGSTFYAEYTPGTKIGLFIHTNGNTQTATQYSVYYAPSTGTFDTSTINMYSIFSSYGNYDDNGDKIYGWYDAEQWLRYCAGLYPANATTFEDVGDHWQYQELHIMLIDNGNNSSTTYNTNTSTADSSNPTTGDYIMMAVTVMAVSAAALALIFFTKKRKASK